MFHVLTLGAMVTCSLLAAWQWGKAGSAMGSALNVGYGLQWPFFALFFGYMWWRMLSLEAAQLESNQTGPSQPGSAPEPETVVDVVEEEPAPAPVVHSGPSPFGPRPVSYVSDEDDQREGRQLSAYNRMLAELAARDSQD
jgi:DNA-binding transcriptional regulator of glucitol operon